MTTPVQTVSTLPYCGACGWDTTQNVGSDTLCDACGADFTAFDGGGMQPPVVVSLTETGGTATLTFTANTDADTTDILWAITGTTTDDTDIVEDISSPYDLLQAMQVGDTMTTRERSVDNGFAGRWGATSTVTKSA